jgi:hypothetical protein
VVFFYLNTLRYPELVSAVTMSVIFLTVRSVIFVWKKDRLCVIFFLFIFLKFSEKKLHNVSPTLCHFLSPTLKKWHYVGRLRGPADFFFPKSTKNKYTTTFGSPNAQEICSNYSIRRWSFLFIFTWNCQNSFFYFLLSILL